MLRGAGVALTDTTVAALIARFSDPDTKALNLGLSSSVQAGARLVGPIVSGALLDLSFRAAASSRALGPPGALPFLLMGVIASLASAIPLVVARLTPRARVPRVVRPQHANTTGLELIQGNIPHPFRA